MSASEETDGPHAPHLPETDLGSKVDSQESHDLAAKTVKLRASERPESGGLASYREFARTLIEIGLIEAVELGRIAVQSPREVLGLSRVLVKAGKLTPYQQFPAWGFPLGKAPFLISHFANPSRIMLPWVPYLITRAAGVARHGYRRR